MNKPGNYLHLWARNTRISFFGQNLPFFSIFHTKFKIEKYFTFWHNFCSTPVLINICVGGFMQNFRTLGLIIKKVRDLFNLPDKYGKIIQCEKGLVDLNYVLSKGLIIQFSLCCLQWSDKARDLFNINWNNYALLIR